MNAPDTTTSILERDQFRMCQLQVFNWGTFSGIHAIPISELGFLFVGRSGTGKTTLLDGISTLLVPPRYLDFNAAARSDERRGRDRNLISYVRGAWGEQREAGSGEVAVQYLRTSTTWSALVLTYRNMDNRYVTLCQVFWVRGNTNSNADVKAHYLVFQRPFDLGELEIFGKSNFDVRKLKQMFPDAALPRNDFSHYCERFCGLLGIESEMSLRLLHKTQSAKNLGDLNTTLRDYMLDTPETFEVAEQLVSEFGELNAAHQAVVTARQQIEMLSPAREEHRRWQSLEDERSILEALQVGFAVYRERRRAELLRVQIEALEVQLETNEGIVAIKQSAFFNKAAELRDLETQHHAAGGDQTERWEEEKSSLESQCKERMELQKFVSDACGKLGWTAPESPHEFAAILSDARRIVEGQDEKRRAARNKQFELLRKKEKTESDFAEAVAEVRALKQQPSSNIPADMLALRRETAEAIGVSEDALPFIGELVEVRPDEAVWRGAIERVLRVFALSVLVGEHHYAALTNHLNGTDLNRRRLAFYRPVWDGTLLNKPVDQNSLILKLNVKDCVHAEWLRALLRQHFDYPCIESVHAFRKTDRGVTKDGLVKHGKARHEKDDRFRIDDRSNWVLGFDNREKLALFEGRAQACADAIGSLTGKLEQAEKEEKDVNDRARTCQGIINIEWEKIDPTPLLEHIARLDLLIETAREGNADLRHIHGLMEACRPMVDQAAKALQDAEVNREGTRRLLDTAQIKLGEHERKIPSVALTEVVELELTARFDSQGVGVDLDSLDVVAQDVIAGIGVDLHSVDEQINACVKFMEGRFAHFIRIWPADADGLDATLAAADDFYVRLVRLERDGLPAHEHRFFELLSNQSHQNLASLSTYLSVGKKDVLERMELVNQSLCQVPFNQSPDQTTYLHIKTTDRQLLEVREFKQELQTTLSYAWGEDREQAEERFKSLRQLVERLSSQEPEARHWRNLVLDVRQHVEFIGREIDEEGVEIEIYRGGSGKSGGQRQKLAATCLAAALRYQLGGADHDFPVYAPVVLDEAFNNADQEFTSLAMNIFENFGFQMIVATPLKAVMTLEPFIGGACFVEIRDRRVSSVLMIEYDTERRRLRLPKRPPRGDGG